MKFSIITVCYNSAKTIRRTFDSILAQDYTDYEYIVVDGASTDGTLEIIKEYEPKFQGKMCWISEPDNGIYDAMNKGIRMAKGDYINIMNSDDQLECGALRAVVQTEKDNPEATVYYGITRCVNENGLETEIFRRHHSLLKNGTIIHQACFFNRLKCLKYGDYDLCYRIAADYDYLLRLNAGNEVMCPVDSILVRYSCSGLSWNQNVRTRHETLNIRYHYGFISRLHVFIDFWTFVVRNRISHFLHRKQRG